MAFHRWGTCTLEQRRLRSVMTKVKSRMVNRSACIIFECWSRYTEVSILIATDSSGGAALTPSRHFNSYLTSVVLCMCYWSAAD